IVYCMFLSYFCDYADLHSFPTRRSSDLFHTSLVLRLTQPWWNMDDGERLLGLGQTYLVRVVTFVSRFKEGGTVTNVTTRTKYVRSEEHTSELQSRRDLV